MRLRRRVRAVLAVLPVLLLTMTGCGGGSEDTSAAKAPTQSASPTPVVDTARTFTRAELAGALPSVKQVEGARRLEIRCRFDHESDKCQSNEDHTLARVVFSAAHSQEKTSEDHSTPHYWRPEEYDVEIDQYADAETATKGLDTQYDLVKEADGPYSTRAHEDGDGERWGGRGTGRVERTELLGLDGVTATVRQVDVDLKGNRSKPVQVAIAAVGWSNYRVISSVILYDDHHQPDDAEKAALGLLEDYVERLGKTA
jgi:hypothetical protein